MTYPLKSINHTLESMYRNHLREKYNYKGRLGEIVGKQELEIVVDGINLELEYFNLVRDCLRKRKPLNQTLLETLCSRYNIIDNPKNKKENLKLIKGAIELSILENATYLLECIGIIDKNKIKLLKQKTVNYQRLYELLDTGNRLLKRWLRQKEIIERIE